MDEIFESETSRNGAGKAEASRCKVCTKDQVTNHSKIQVFCYVTLCPVVQSHSGSSKPSVSSSQLTLPLFIQNVGDLFPDAGDTSQKIRFFSNAIIGILNLIPFLGTMAPEHKTLKTNGKIKYSTRNFCIQLRMRKCEKQE